MGSIFPSTASISHDPDNPVLENGQQTVAEEKASVSSKKSISMLNPEKIFQFKNNVAGLVPDPSDQHGEENFWQLHPPTQSLFANKTCKKIPISRFKTSISQVLLGFILYSTIFLLHRAVLWGY